MSFGVGIGDIVLVITAAIDVGKKIKDAPDEIEAVIDSLSELKFYMNLLKSVIESRASDLEESTTNELRSNLDGIRQDVKEIKKILRAWDEKEGPNGIKLRSQHVYRWVWPFGSSPKRMRELQENIKKQRTHIAEYWGIINAMPPKDKHKNAQFLVPKPLIERQSKSPNRKAQYNIIFIDPYNENRSVIAQAHTQLLLQWTAQTNGRWPIKWNQSAGLLVKRQSETIAIQESIGMQMANGGEKSATAPMDSLFEKSPYNGPLKNEMWKMTSERASRGLKMNLFTDYDFILVFNKKHAKQLEALREAFPADKRGKAGMGEIKFLGAYGETGTAEIWNPWTRAGRVSTARAAWEPVVWNIRTSVEGFLQTECGWVKPADETKSERAN